MRQLGSRLRPGIGLALVFVCVSAAAVAADQDRVIEAVKQSNLASLRTLLARTPNANVAEPDGTTALHWAAQQDDPEFTTLLLSAGADPKAANRYGITPLALAAERGNAAIVGALLKAGADPEKVAPGGETALMIAARTGRTEAVRVLLARGARVNAVETVRGQSPLMWAAAEGHLSEVEALVAAGADVMARSKGGFTPYLFAVREGHLPVVRALLNSGAPVNDTKRSTAVADAAVRTQGDAEGETSALVLAVINGHFDLAAFLLEHGADPNLPDPRGSALHALAWMRRPGMTLSLNLPPKPSGELDALGLAKLLLEKGANPNRRVTWKEIPFDRDDGEARNPPGIRVGRNYLSLVGATPFYLAAHHGDAEYARLLAAHGADPLMPNAQGVTPLMAAAGLGYWEGETPGPITGTPERERLEVVALALQLGGDVNAVAPFGNVHPEGDGQVLLNEYVANLEEDPAAAVGDVRWAGSTALHGAAVANQPQIVRYLVEHGAKLDARNVLGWTPLMVTQGMFVAAHGGLKRTEAEAALRELMIERHLDPAQYGQRVTQSQQP
jgi:uncharacterized protein